MTRRTTEHVRKAAAALAKLGSSKGGKARAAKLSERERRAIARKGGKARWQTKKSSA